LALDGRAGGCRNSLAGRPLWADAVAPRQRLAAAARVRRATARAWPRAKRGPRACSHGCTRIFLGAQNGKVGRRAAAASDRAALLDARSVRR